MFSLDILAFIYWIIFIMASRVVIVGSASTWDKELPPEHGK